jgi:hypothetical protein
MINTCEAFSKWLKEMAIGKKQASKIDPVAARLANCIGKEDKKKLKLKIPRGGYLVRRGFQGVILVEAAPAKKNKKKAAAKPKKATAKPKKRKPAAKKAALKKKGTLKKRLATP